MDSSKELLLQRLLKDEKITQDEYYLLNHKDIEYILQSPVNPIDFPPVGRQSLPNSDWMQKEFDNRQRIAENCGCNPANGGNGICFCILTGMVIY